MEDKHVFINWTPDIPGPHGLDGATEHVASESGAGDDFTETVDVGVMRKGGRELKRVRRCTCKMVGLLTWRY